MHMHDNNFGSKMGSRLMVYMQNKVGYYWKNVGLTI
jgi:hypothetical protein